MVSMPLGNPSSRCGAQSDAIDWARRLAGAGAVALIRQSPWGTTLCVDGATGACYLKVLPPAQAGAVASVVAISAALPGAAPVTLASDVSRGWLLSADHGGQPFGHAIEPGSVRELLRGYADIQARSARVLDRLGVVPRLSVSALWLRACAFLDGRPHPPARTRQARLADFVGGERAALIADAVGIVSAALLRRFAQCEHSPLVLEHGDLNLGNAARTGAGGLVLHDWDNALIGPPGLSFSSVVGDTARLCTAAGAAGAGADDSAGLVDHYAVCLAEAGLAPLEALRGILPSAVLAGLFVRLTAYADYPPEDEAQRALCVPDLEQIGGEILAWCCRLAMHECDGDALTRIVNLLHTQRDSGALLDLAREAGADALLAALPSASGVTLEVARFAQAEADGRRVDRVPSLPAGAAAHDDPALGGLEVEVATGMFVEHGCLVLEDAFPPSLIARCLAHYQGGLACEAGVWPDVGDGRTMLPLRVGGPFNAPELYAQPLLMRLLTQLLGPDFLIGSMTLVVSQPCAGAQHLHADHPPLFGGFARAADLPPHAVTVLIPLVDLDEVVGGTEVRKGSHRMDDGQGAPAASRALPVGGCLLFDYRLLHRGLANRSDRERPVLSIVYHRDWFRDAVNFREVPPLRMSLDELMRVPASLSGLFRLAELVH